jgi:hypothetical protein
MAVQGNGNGNGRRIAPPPARKNDATPQVGLPGLFAGPVASPPAMPETQVEPVPNARDDSPPVEVGAGTTLQEPAPVAPPDAPQSQKRRQVPYLPTQSRQPSIHGVTTSAPTQRPGRFSLGRHGVLASGRPNGPSNFSAFFMAFGVAGCVC